MPRPRSCRRVAGPPGCVWFKPAGIPASQLVEIVLEIDELEAVRLADLEGLYHEDAAQQMNISRQTFGRIVTSARKKVAQALVQGDSLRIEGGEIEMAEQRTFRCIECDHEWQLPFGTGRPAECPQCTSENIRRAEEQRGIGPESGAGSGRGRGRGKGRKGARGRGRNQ